MEKNINDKNKHSQIAIKTNNKKGDKFDNSNNHLKKIKMLDKGKDLTPTVKQRIEYLNKLSSQDNPSEKVRIKKDNQLINHVNNLFKEDEPEMIAKFVEEGDEIKVNDYSTLWGWGIKQGLVSLGIATVVVLVLISINLFL